MGVLIPLALALAPEIGKWLFGDTGEKTGAAVAQVVQAVTGTGDAAAAQVAIAANPELATQLRVQLAQIAAQAEQAARQADLDSLRAQLADVANARAQTVALAGGKSPMQWAAAIVSVVVLGTFGLVMLAALTRAVPAGSETMLNMLMGTLASMSTAVVAFWVGSSAGSQQKTDLLYRSAPAPGGGAATAGPFGR